MAVSRKSRAQRPKRPLSEYIKFGMKIRPELKAIEMERFPGKSWNDLTREQKFKINQNIIVAIGDRWRKMTGKPKKSQKTRVISKKTRKPKTSKLTKN